MLGNLGRAGAEVLDVVAVVLRSSSRKPTPPQSPKRPPRSLLGNDLGGSWWIFATLCGSRQIRWKMGLVELGSIASVREPAGSRREGPLQVATGCEH